MSVKDFPPHLQEKFDRSVRNNILQHKRLLKIIRNSHLPAVGAKISVKKGKARLKREATEAELIDAFDRLVKKDGCAMWVSTR